MAWCRSAPITSVSSQRATIRGTDTNLQMQATIPTNSTAPASMLLLGNINLQIAQLFSPDITSSGEVRLNINSYGARSNPNIQGQVQIVNASLASGSVPIGLQNGNGTLTLTRDRLDITHFQGTVGGGTVNASGGLIYRPSLRFDLAMAAKDMRLLYPQGIREGLDLNLTLAGTREAAVLGGRVQVTPELVELKEKGAPASRWQQRFEAELTDVFRVQSEIAMMPRFDCMTAPSRTMFPSAMRTIRRGTATLSAGVRTMSRLVAGLLSLTIRT